MSLRFGLVAPQDWDKIKSGMRADRVDTADYVGELTEVRHIDPSKNEKGLGTYIVTFGLTEDNEEKWRGKVVEFQCKYHPAPTTDGYVKMNEISLRNIVNLIEASNVEPIAAPDGNMDAVATLQTMPMMKPKVVFTVTHRDYEGREMQDVENFRAMV